MSKHRKLLPNRALLEFMAEFDEGDDELFKVVLYHGKRDSQMEELEQDISKSDTGNMQTIIDARGEDASPEPFESPGSHVAQARAVEDDEMRGQDDDE